MISLIVAMDKNRLIGNNNQLPWHLPADLKHFKEITTGHPIIMGRKTYESIGKPLPNRKNIIITRQPDFNAQGCIVANSIEDAVKKAGNPEEIFIIGGTEIFKQSLDLADKIYLTEIHHSFDGDTYFPNLDNKWKETERVTFNPDEKNLYPYSFVTLVKNY